MGYLLLFYILFSPILILIIWYCIKLEEQHNKEKRINYTSATTITSAYYPTLNHLRGTSKPVKKHAVHKNDELNDFLEQYSKILAISMTEQSSFIVPIEVCDNVISNLKEWFDKKAEVQYAIIEEDGLHVKMEAN